jgi:hypothetical protein
MMTETTRCPACGILSDTPDYCTDCQQSGQAAYDVADRAAATWLARSLEPRGI